jgi:hypothetical protein
MPALHLNQVLPILPQPAVPTVFPNRISVGQVLAKCGFTDAFEVVEANSVHHARGH